ncbi:hypothetical protein PRIC2_011469 [Phytophthora ramorum]
MFHIPALVYAFLSGHHVPPIAERDALRTERPQDTDEFHELFRRTSTRLRCIHTSLIGRGVDNLRTSVGVLVLFQRLVARFRAAVHKHAALNVLVRFVTKRSTLEKLQELHGVIDRLFGYLGLLEDPEMVTWREEWDGDCDRMHKLFTQRVDQPKFIVARLPNAEIAEMLAILKFELEFHRDELSSEQKKLMKDTCAKVMRCTNVKVPRISAFYIPTMDVDLGSHYESVRDTICDVKRGVYDQETRLVAQYLYADRLYARQLFWRATEIWHGFQHPNVSKMLGESLVQNQPLVVWEDAAAHGNFIHFFAGEHDNHQRRLWRMFLQVGHGLNYIHQQGQTHGNLKCSHILVARNGTPKICHFELSKGSTVGGVDRWKSPEYNLGTGIDPSKAGDVYAFGLCIIEARSGGIPYGLECDEHVKDQLQLGDCYPRPEDMRDDEWDVVKRFVAHNPNDRPTMAQAIEMLEELAWKEALEEETDADRGVKTA